MDHRLLSAIIAVLIVCLLGVVWIVKEAKPDPNDKEEFDEGKVIDMDDHYHWKKPLNNKVK